MDRWVDGWVGEWVDRWVGGWVGLGEVVEVSGEHLTWAP